MRHLSDSAIRLECLGPPLETAWKINADADIKMNADIAANFVDKVTLLRYDNIEKH